MQNTKKVLIFGAGQGGSIAANLLRGHEIVAYCDNNRQKQYKKLDGIPILPPREGLALEPECVCIAVLDPGRSAEMREALIDAGFTGEIMDLSALRQFDARIGVLGFLAKELEFNKVPGDLAEVGVYQGEFARIINGVFPQRRLHLFDTFSGFSIEDIKLEKERHYSKAALGDFSDTSAQQVHSIMPYPENVMIHKGLFPETFSEVGETNFALVSLDVDLYTPTLAALECFWPRMSTGGCILIHDYNSCQYRGVAEAVRQFSWENSVFPVPLPDLHGTAVLVKQG